MVQVRPVSISNGAFIFCRYTLAILLWTAFFLQFKFVVVVAFVIFFLSAFFKVGKAPLILLYTYTLNNFIKSEPVLLDENAMRLVHSLGAIFTLISITLLYFINEQAGWIFLFFLAVLKTISALGYCPATKLYSCMLSGGSCCRRLRTFKC